MAGLLGAVAPAHAAACASPKGTHIFNGKALASNGNHSTTVYGARADLELTSPHVCDTGNGGVSWWVMVESPFSVLEYAQVGFIKHANGQTPYVFTEYNDGTRTDFNTVPRSSWWREKWALQNPAFGALYGPFRVEYNFTKGKLVMSWGGTALAETPFDPAVKWKGQNWVGSFQAESHDVNTDVPGMDNDTATFANVQIKTSRTTAYEPYGIGQLKSGFPTVYLNRELNDGHDFEIWTKRPPACPTCGVG